VVQIALVRACIFLAMMFGNFYSLRKCEYLPSVRQKRCADGSVTGNVSTRDMLTFYQARVYHTCGREGGSVSCFQRRIRLVLDGVALSSSLCVTCVSSWFVPCVVGVWVPFLVLASADYVCSARFRLFVLGITRWFRGEAGKRASLAIGFEVTQLGGRSLWLESVFAWRCSLGFIEVIGRDGHVAQAEENLR
jgi:hypothetical protein